MKTSIEFTLEIADFTCFGRIGYLEKGDFKKAAEAEVDPGGATTAIIAEAEVGRGAAAVAVIATIVAMSVSAGQGAKGMIPALE